MTVLKRTMRITNDGLTVKINFWSLKKYANKYDAQGARHHIKGQATNVGTGKARFFRDAGALLAILSDWNAAQLKKIKQGNKMKTLLAAVLLTTIAASTTFAAPQTAKEFYVYTDAGSPLNHFIPSGYMGDFGDIKMTPAFDKNPAAGKTCIRVEYSAQRKQGAGWAGVYWQSPANNWGDKRGGFDLTGFKKMTFMAKGEKGGEMIDKFGFGGIVGGTEDGDTDGSELFSIELKKQWTKYEIDLKGLDMGHIIGGFLWAANGDSNPDGAVFYIDEIVFVK